MVKKILFYILAVTISLFGLYGCTGMSDQAQTKAEGTAVGVAGGAILGGLLGYVTGGQRGAVTGAVVGGMIGGAVGYEYGARIAAKKAAYAREEDWLDAAILNARAINRDLETYRASLETQVASLETETAGLEEAYRNNQLDDASKQAYKEKVAKVSKANQEKIALAKAEIADKEAVLADAKGEASAPRRQQLSQELDQMKSNTAAIEEKEKSVASLPGRLGI